MSRLFVMCKLLHKGQFTHYYVLECRYLLITGAAGPWAPYSFSHLKTRNLQCTCYITQCVTLNSISDCL
uniref:Uncharacterized protein n=1 Tax=Anguilla anguilla TaxID=7936 RepID=A0A0E9X7Y0_ANGAN